MTTQYFTPAKMFWIENNNFSPVLHAAPSSRVGGQGRGSSLGYNSETVLVFDLSSLAGKTITGATLDSTISGYDGIRTVAYNATISTQNRTRHEWWASPTIRYDDFGSYIVEWDTVLQTASVPFGGGGTINFPSSAALVAEIQKQISGVAAEWGNDTRDWQDGLIIRSNMTQWQYFTTFSQWRLGVDVVDTTIGLNDYYYRKLRKKS